VLPKWAWSGSCKQFLHCGLRKFRHSKSSVYRWYTQFDRRRFVYDTWDNGSRLGRVMVECTLFMTHCLQLHTISLVRTCRISSFCTVAWQLARLLLTRCIARSLGDSWASCFTGRMPFLPPNQQRQSTEGKNAIIQMKWNTQNHKVLSRAHVYLHHGAGCYQQTAGVSPFTFKKFAYSCLVKYIYILNFTKNQLITVFFVILLTNQQNIAIKTVLATSAGVNKKQQTK